MSRVVVTGADGLLGSQLVAAFRGARYDVVGLTHADIDLEDAATLSRIEEASPDVVINAAAWTDVDGCAQDPDRAMRVNGEGAGLVAQAAARSSAMVVQISTNEVFEGEPHRVYAENDTTQPINPYGLSKLTGERRVAAATDRHLIVRTAWLYSRERGFPARIRLVAQRLSRDEPLRVVDDEWGNPTPASRLATAIVAASRRALADESLRVLHLAGQPAATRYDWAATLFDAQDRRLERIKRRDYSRASAVPQHAVLSTDCARGLGMEPIRWRDMADGDGP